MRNFLIVSAGFVGIVLISYLTTIFTRGDRRPASPGSSIPGVEMVTIRNNDDTNNYTKLTDTNTGAVCYIVASAVKTNPEPSIFCLHR